MEGKNGCANKVTRVIMHNNVDVIQYFRNNSGIKKYIIKTAHPHPEGGNGTVFVFSPYFVLKYIGKYRKKYFGKIKPV